MLTVRNDDAKSSELMVKAFLGASFQQPLFFNCFYMCGSALHKNIWCKKDIGWCKMAYGVRGLSRMCCVSMVRKGIYGKLLRFM